MSTTPNFSNYYSLYGKERARLVISEYMGNPTLNCWGANNTGSKANIRLTPELIRLLAQSAKSLKDAVPNTEHTLISKRWNPETKTKDILDYQINLRKDDKNLYYIKAQNQKAQGKPVEEFLFSFTNTIDINSIPMTDVQKSNLSLDVFINILERELIVMRIVSRIGYTPPQNNFGQGQKQGGYNKPAQQQGAQPQGAQPQGAQPQGGSAGSFQMDSLPF